MNKYIKWAIMGAFVLGTVALIWLQPIGALPSFAVAVAIAVGVGLLLDKLDKPKENTE